MRAVVLALTVALVSSHQINLEFPAGKTFVYMYEGLLLGGLPQEGLGKAGVKVSSKVLIRAEAQNTFLLKLMDPQIFQCTGIWPQDPCVPASKLTAALNAQLAIPIKLEYSNGVVGKVFSPAGVSATVLNLHRGILNIFQLNLKNTQNVYELHEAGPHGVCKTHYTIREDEKTRQITVTKSKDLNNCHERVIKDIGLAYAETCAECQERRQSLTGTATYSYIMKPTAAGALISEATVEELHQFSLFNTITGAAQMKAKQTLNLLEVQNTPLSPISGLYMARGSLKYEFATEILQTPIQLLKINNAEAQIAEVLQHLATNNMAMAHEGAPLKFIQLVQLMRVATFECIQNIWNQHKTKPVYRRWILDTIPVVGTPASVRFLKEKFQADEFAIPELTQALLVGLHLATANPDTIHQTASLATHPKIKAIPVLREVIMLAYGSMIARHCAEDPTCSADLLKPIHDLAAQAISRAEISEITLALKVLGNAGHPASLKPIMKLLPGFVSAAASMPVRVQVDAILALRNIAKREPKLVQPVALQLFMDKTLHPEVRTVALIVLFETKPSVALMTTIANAVHKEADKHVASFTYSYIKSLTKSMAPDLKDVAAAANVAMRILCPKMDRLSYRFSTAYQLDLYLSPLMAGAAGTAFIINDAATILPRAFLAKARAYLAGAAADVLEVGFRTDGLQDAVQKPHPADQNADRITRIKSTMQAIKDWKSMSAKQPLGSVYVKLLGQEIAFANIDKSFIDHIIQQTAQVTRLYARELKEIVKSLQKGIAFQYAKPILATELRRIIPTTVGVPMELDFYTAVVASASINVKAIITSSLPEQLEATSLDQLMKTDFQLQAEARTSVSMQSFAVIGVNTALIQAAVMTRGKIRAVAPAKLAVKADLPKGHFKVEALPTSAPDHVADFSLETVAVARNIEDLPNEKVVSLVPAQPSQAESWLPTSIQKTFCGDGPTLERLEFEIDIGRNAAQKLVKEVSVLKSENQEENFILLKLGHVLGSGTTDRNYHSRLSRSLGSSSNSSSSSSSSNSTSSSRVSQGSGRPLGPSRIRRDKGVLQCMNMLKLGHVLGSGTTDRNYHSRLSRSLGSSSNSSSSSSSSNSTSSSRVSQGSIRPYGHSRIRRNKEVLQCMNMLKLGHVLDSGTTDRNYHSRLSRSLGSSSNSSSSSSSSNSTSSSRVSQGSIRPYGHSRIRRDKEVLQCMTMLKLGHVLGSGTTDRNYHSRLSRSLGSSSNSSSSSSSSNSTSSSTVSQGSIRPYGHSRIRRDKVVLQCMTMLKLGHVLGSGMTDRNYHSRLSRSLGSSSNSSSSSSSSNSTSSSRVSQGSIRPYGHSRIRRDKEVLQCMNMLKLGHVLGSGTTDRNYHSRLSRSLGSSSNSSSSSSSSNSTSSSRVSQGSIRPYGPSKIRRDKVVLQCMTMLKLGHVLGSGTTDRNYHSRLSRSLGSSSNSSSSSSSSISTSSSRVSQGSIRPYGHSRIRRVKEVLQCMNMLKQGHVLDSGTTDRNYYSRLSRSLGSSSNSSSSSSSSNSTISSRSSQGAVRPYGHSRIHRDKFLEDAIPPAFAIVARAVRSDRSVGYLIAGYLDRSTARSQIVISSIADQGKWKMCADGVLSSKHKLNAEVSWGKECQEYNVTFKAKAGIHDSNPALHFEVEWDRHPRLYLVTSYVKWISEYIPTSSQNTGLSIENTDNKKREVAVIVDLPTQRSLNIIVRAPQMTLTQMDVQLPVALPIEKDGRISALQNVDIQSTIKKLDSDFRARNRNATIETLQKLMQQLQKVGENVLDDMEAAERSSNTGN